MTRFYPKKPQRETRLGWKETEMFRVNIDDLLAGAPGIDKERAIAEIGRIKPEEIDSFRTRYSMYMSENFWKYHNPRFEQTLTDMLRKDGKLTPENEAAYLKIVEAGKRRIGARFFHEAFMLPSHYAILKVLGVALDIK